MVFPKINLNLKYDGSKDFFFKVPKEKAFRMRKVSEIVNFWHKHEYQVQSWVNYRRG